MVWRDNLVYVLSIGFAVGVGLQTFVSVSFVWLLVFSCIAIGVGLLARTVATGTSRTRLRLLTLGIVMVVFGVWRMDAAQTKLITPELDVQVYETIDVEGVVFREPEIRPNSLHVHIQTDQSRLLLIVDRHTDVFYGDTVAATGRLQVPEPFAAELGRMFPYDGFLAARGITHTMFYPDIEIVDTGGGNIILRALLLNKAAFIERIEAIIPEPQVGLAEGLLLGVKRAMSDDTLAAFRTTGIIHIVVLSGFNVMLVVAFVRYVFGIVLPLRPRLIASFIAVVAFALTVGLTATVVRASIMASLLLLAQYLGRTYEAIRGLFVAGAVMIAFNPYLLVYDIGFQLSFVATLGLILVAPHMEIMFATVPAKVGARGYFVATIATQIAVTPLLLYQVGEFSTVSPIVNILILPMVPVAMILTFATGMVSLVLPGLAEIIGFTAYLSLWYILIIAEWFATVPLAAFWVPAFPFVWVPVSYALLWWLYRWHVKRSERKIDTKSLPTKTDIDVSSWHIVSIEEIDKQIKPKRLGSNGASPPVFFR